MYRHRVLPRTPAVLVRLDGDFDLPRSLATLDALEELRISGGIWGLIWDARRRMDYPTASEVRWLLTRFDRWERVVILTGPDAQYGMARMAALLSAKVVAARTTSEALSWIKGTADQS